MTASMVVPDCTVYVLPGLGLNAAAASPIVAELDPRFELVAIELPGHGDGEDAPDGSVDAQTDAALAAIGKHADGGPWLLCAHSMGGKVAARIAQRVRDGEADVFGLMGVVLLAPSPPSPEPMPADKRRQMLAWVDDGPISEHDARTFLDDNLGAPLPATLARDVLDGVQATSPLAWRRWLKEGSEEDLATSIGVLDLPCVVLAGDQDAALGTEAQPGLLSDVYPRARFVSLSGAGHLLTYERPADVAEAIASLWDEIDSHRAAVPAEWGRLIASERTVPRVRSSLSRRAIADVPAYQPRVLTPAQLEVLRSIADRLVPQPPGSLIDIAARVDADLAAGGGDGWRPAGALSDVDAYRAGLDDLARVWPKESEAQLAVVQAVVAGEGVGGAALSRADLQRWFEDVRVDLTREWLYHPASLARIGYDGFATGAEAVALAGYRTLEMGLRDDWEPSELGRHAASDEAMSGDDEQVTG